MTLSIGFFGDSFCADTSPYSWCNLLADKLGCEKPMTYGKKGESIWGTMFRFKNRIKTESIPDISVFCWTEPYRLYHPKLILTANTQPSRYESPKIYEALDDYWKYLHSEEKDELAYSYALQWFDQNELSKTGKKIIQLWSFRPFETSQKDAGIKLKTGLFLDHSLYAFSKTSRSKEKTINHMTVEQNQNTAQFIADRSKEYLASK